MRRWLLALGLGILTAGCERVVDCAEGKVQSGDVCVDADTDVVDTDVVDTEVVDTDLGPTTSPVTVSWVTNKVPNANVLVLDCDGRRIMKESNFTFPSPHEKVFSLQPGLVCHLVLQDVDGGVLPGGSIQVCSKEIQTWEEERGRKRQLPDFTVFACTSGCTDEVAENYDEDANLDDGSCIYVEGCTDPEATNFDPKATKDDGTCDFGGFGLLELELYVDGGPADTLIHVVCDGDEVLTVSPDSRYPWTTQHLSQIAEAGHLCTVAVEDAAGNAGPAGQMRVCETPVLTWEPTSSPNGKPYTVEVGTFRTEACSGCTDPLADNYDASAKVDDGTCTY